MRKKLKDWVSQATESELECRDLAHPWQPYTAKQIPTGFERQLYCGRCGSIKTQELSKTGTIIRSRMTYSLTYLLPAGTGRLTKKDRGNLRVLQVRAKIKQLQEME